MLSLLSHTNWTSDKWAEVQTALQGCSSIWWKVINIRCELAWVTMHISTEQMLLRCFSRKGHTGACEVYESCQRSIEVNFYKHYSYHLQSLLFNTGYGFLKSHCGHCCFRTLQVYVPIRQFFYNLIHPDYSAVTDVYVLMFLADTVDFIIIVFGFWAFGVCHIGHLCKSVVGSLAIIACDCSSSTTLFFLFRNTLQQQILPLHYQRTRFQRHFWWWCSFSLVPWW